MFGFIHLKQEEYESLVREAKDAKELYDNTKAALNEVIDYNKELHEHGLTYQRKIQDLKAQLKAEEMERLAKDATLQQIRTILDRHYKM